MLVAVSPMQKDISRVDFPEDYPFPKSVLGRGRDFRSVFILMLTFQCLRETRACWFIATEVGVSSIPVSEVMFISSYPGT